MRKERYTAFPPPLPLPRGVQKERARRNKLLIRAAMVGIFVRLLIIVAELFGYFFFHSVALLVDALGTIVDVTSTVALVICVKAAERPPDDDHPFGHGRYEPLAGIFSSMLLILIGGGVLIEQVLQLAIFGGSGVIDPRTWLIPLAAAILLEIVYRISIRVARGYHSPALAAEASHFRVDALNSLLAMVALGVGALVPAWSVSFDHYGAVAIAALMVGLGVFAARDNLRQLMDYVPEQAWFDRVRNAATRVAGVMGTEKIRIQRYGPDAHVDIDIEVEPSLPVSEAHAISQRVRLEIQRDWPAVRDVTVHIEPFYPGDH